MPSLAKKSAKLNFVVFTVWVKSVWKVSHSFGGILVLFNVSGMSLEGQMRQKKPALYF